MTPFLFEANACVDGGLELFGQGVALPNGSRLEQADGGQGGECPTERRVSAPDTLAGVVNRLSARR
jgi:hypothetical protein